MYHIVFMSRIVAGTQGWPITLACGPLSGWHTSNVKKHMKDVTHPAGADPPATPTPPRNHLTPLDGPHILLGDCAGHQG